MGIRFACHVCEQKLNIKSELAGRRGICPKCSSRIRIPLTDAERSLPIESTDAAGGGQIQAELPAQSGQPDEQPPPPQPVTILDHESEATWYVRPPSGGQYGPATTSLLQQWIDEGRVAATALLWRDGWPQWRQASEALPELIGQLPDSSPQSSTQPEPRDPVPAATPPTPPQTPAVPAESIPNQSQRGSPSLKGDANVGVKRRNRSIRRLYLIGGLTVVATVLLGTLVFILSRS